MTIENYEFDQDIYLQALSHLRQYLLPLGVIVVCIILFANVILPQINTLNETKQKEQDLRDSIAQLKQNIQYLDSVDANQVRPQFEIMTTALPLEKDFVGIINTLSRSVSVSGVSLSDYSFQVGNVSTQSAVPTQQYLSIELTVVGTVDSARRFVSELSQRFPLSEVKTLTLTSSGATVSIKFYYQPFSTKDFNPLKPINPLTSQQLRLIQEFSDWKAQADSKIIKPVAPTVSPSPTKSPATGSATLQASPSATPTATSSGSF